MKVLNRALASLFFLSGAALFAQTPTVTIQSNMDVGEYVIQVTGASVAQDSITGAVTSTNCTPTGAYPVIFCSLLCQGTVGHTFQPQYSGTQPTNFTLTGVNTGATITVATANVESSVKESGVVPTFATGGTVIHEGGTLTPLNTTLQDDTYVGSFPPLVIADTTSGTTSAPFQFIVTIRIQTGIAIVKLSDLAFGDVIANGAAGTVILSAAGGRTFSGGASQGPTGGTVASFNVIGKTGGNATSRRYQITFAGSGTPGAGSVTLTSGASTMTASLQAYIAGAIPALGRGTLASGTGEETFQVGGTLNVATNQAEGDYLGVFTVTVTYN